MASEKQLKPVVMEGARIAFRNFSGKEGKYNAAGQRNFAVFLDPQLAQDMASDGWNVKQLKPREEGDVPQDYLNVKVSYRGRPPRVVMVTSKGKTDLDEDSVMVLDWVEIANVDLILNPYHWDVSGNQGITAYVKSIFVTIVEDFLEQKYADVPENRIEAAPERLQIESGGRIPRDPDEIVIEDDEDVPAWAR